MADAALATVRNRTLEKLFVLIAGETAETEDAEIVERVIANVNEQLRDDEICYWSDTATPRALVESLAAYYACFLANDFMDASEALTLKNDPNTGKEACEREIRALVAPRKRVATPVQNTYF